MTTSTYEPIAPSSENRWQAVLERNPHADGAFVYAVRSTGVYCRPICPSRHPRRSVVEFFANGAAAVEAGFRACKRCRPDDDASADVARVRPLGSEDVSLHPEHLRRVGDRLAVVVCRSDHHPCLPLSRRQLRDQVNAAAQFEDVDRVRGLQLQGDVRIEAFREAGAVDERRRQRHVPGDACGGVPHILDLGRAEVAHPYPRYFCFCFDCSPAIVSAARP